jgi:hypothetical protein
MKNKIVKLAVDIGLINNEFWHTKDCYILNCNYENGNSFGFQFSEELLQKFIEIGLVKVIEEEKEFTATDMIEFAGFVEKSYGDDIDYPELLELYRKGKDNGK